MTPAELKRCVDQGQDELFFDPRTMRFFGDTMKNYGVREGPTFTTHYDDTGNNYDENRKNTIETWELYRKKPTKHGCRSSAYFCKRTFRRVFPELA